jgi:multidrug resistance protein MdtO
MREPLLRVADVCAVTRHAVVENEWDPESEDEGQAMPSALGAGVPSPADVPALADMHRTLEQLWVVTSIEASKPATREPGHRLLVADATANPEYRHFAVKGTLAALVCYILLIGFDYPGIYTSVITCFVVSLSTIGSSNQKGLLRFGGAALGGVMGLLALMYAFPNLQGLGGFWLVFATGTAVAAWINFGSPRISYGGYQTGLAFYKATLQELGPAVSATVVRDRLIGVAFGLVVFDVVEHLLWPVRAADRMHVRLADVFRTLAAFARVASRRPDEASDVTARRQLISQQLLDVQGLIESSKFEAGTGAADTQAVQRLTGDAQTVFVSLLAIARAAEFPGAGPDAMQAIAREVDERVAAILDGVAAQVYHHGAARPIADRGSLAAVSQSITAAIDATNQDARYTEARALYRALAVAVSQLTAVPSAVLPSAMVG